MRRCHSWYFHGRKNKEAIDTYSQTYIDANNAVPIISWSKQKASLRRWSRSWSLESIVAFSWVIPFVALVDIPWTLHLELSALLGPFGYLLAHGSKIMLLCSFYCILISFFWTAPRIRCLCGDIHSYPMFDCNALAFDYLSCLEDSRLAGSGLPIYCCYEKTTNPSSHSRVVHH